MARAPRPDAETETDSPPVITRVQVAHLHADPANLRRHDERSLAAIAASLARFGQVKPVVVDGKNVVRAGNGTLAAAKILGWTELDVVRTTLTGAEAVAYAIADNRTSDLSSFDADLAAVLAGLQSDGLDLDAIGFTADEVEALCRAATPPPDPAADPGPQVDRAEELQTKWDTAPGQLWVVPSLATPGKEHRLLCGDGTDADDVARVMGGETAGLCLTDPPYGIGIANNPVRQKHAKSDWDDSPASPAAIRACVESAPVAIIWGGNYFGLPASQGFFVWDKKQPEEFSLSMCEMAWTNLQSPAKLYRESVTSYAKDHPTQKPVGLIAWCMGKAEGLVFDPFCGSGTTVVAAEQTGRLCRGVEIAPKYVAVALERLAGMGLSPRRAD